ncbi:Ribosomal RNA small subunit methyltransferase E [BD1-7 clade bacterium]|uniref:Ribosomal RNA small subunit methyltransferase E n=1 Tax=BD1-7 clade bacterium TaxID=2029982 RepID=A0A5S9QBT7_9GAMM|nr:Ribosomal RNA small subunit methyltransferase E [BD1-7 clade bacterium]
MRIPRIFTDNPLNANQAVIIDGPAANHLSRVLRLTAGHPVVLFNGKGGHYPSKISDISKKTVTLLPGERSDSNNESPLETHIAIGVSKGDKMDLIVQKATELGVTSITPLLTQRTDVKLNAERWQKKHGHWQQVAISACEQSTRDTLPEIHSPVRFTEWIQTARQGLTGICHPENGQRLAALDAQKSITLAFGSEGGFTDEEVAEAIRNQAITIGLGPRVLRAETAPLAALAICQNLWGDF